MRHHLEPTKDSPEPHKLVTLQSGIQFTKSEMPVTQSIAQSDGATPVA